MVNGAVANANGAHFSSCNKLLHGSYDVYDERGIFWPVKKVEIKVIQIKLFQSKQASFFHAFFNALLIDLLEGNFTRQKKTFARIGSNGTSNCLVVLVNVGGIDE